MKYISIRVVEAEDHGEAVQAVEAGAFLDDVQVEGYYIADKVLPLTPELSEAVREAVRLQDKADNALMRSYSEKKTFSIGERVVLKNFEDFGIIKKYDKKRKLYDLTPEGSDQTWTMRADELQKIEEVA